MDIGESKSTKSGEAFWTKALQELIRNTVNLLLLAKIPISVEAMSQVISSAPDDLLEAASPEWTTGSFCGQALLLAEKNHGLSHDFRVTSTYWLHTFGGLAEKTRSIIRISFTSLSSPFIMGCLRDLFCTETNIDLEECWTSGKIIVVDLPVIEYAEIGQIAQVLFKFIFQRAIQRRNVKIHPKTAFIWVDEAQYFLSQNDYLFLSTARSSRTATVFLTQNLPGLLNAGGGEGSRAQIDTLMGNFQTKIFHENSDPKTNEFASNTIGKTYRDRLGRNWNEKGNGMSASEQLDYQVGPVEFTTLKKGRGGK